MLKSTKRVNSLVRIKPDYRKALLKKNRQETAIFGDSSGSHAVSSQALILATVMPNPSAVTPFWPSYFL